MAVVWVRGFFFYFGVKNQPDYKNWAQFRKKPLCNQNIIFRNIAENVEVEIELVFFWP